MIGLLAASVLIFGLDKATAVFVPVKGAAEAVAMPVQFGLYRFGQGASDAFSFLTFWRSGEARIKQLEQRVLELEGEKRRADGLEKENGQLRVQLGVAALGAKVMLPATVLGVGRRMEIAVGSSDGVREGMSVVYLDGLIGRVGTVWPRESFVVLPGDPDSKVPAKTGATRGLAVGRFGTGVVLTQVAQTDRIGLGDTVVTSGEGGTYVPGLTIGRVAKITGASTDLFREAILEPFIDYQGLTTVFVILD